MMDAPYVSPHSFGETYGEHRKVLELSDEEHYEIFKYAKAKGLDFIETLCAPGCLSLLKKFEPDFLKVASRDLTNHPLLSALAETKIPIILSTGMSGPEELKDALHIVTNYHHDVSVLHCVSEYPTRPENVNLRTIAWLQAEYPQFRIGYSDHTIGISAAVAAVALGAEIIEKHITLDRRLKGTDQSGSLGPDGLKRMVRDIRLTEISLGEETMKVQDSTKTAKEKLERSVAAKVDIRKGELVTQDKLHLLSPGTGVKWSELHLILGKRTIKNVSANTLVLPEHLSDE
jgi:sialic acid synthase